MLLLALIAAAGGLYWWKNRPHESAECDRLDAELEAIEERQYQVIANMAGSDDPVKQGEWAGELIDLERAFNAKAAEQAQIQDCEPWTVREPE